MNDRFNKGKFFLLVAGLVSALYLSFASLRLSRMCDFWDYYNYPELKQGSQITFAELFRYSMWWERAPSYSWGGCLSELRVVEGAIDFWAFDNNKTAEEAPTWENLKPYFGYADISHPAPICPYGGRYILGTVEGAPRCTIEDHAFRQNLPQAPTNVPPRPSSKFSIIDASALARIERTFEIDSALNTKRDQRWVDETLASGPERH